MIDNQFYIYLMGVAGVAYILWEVVNGRRLRKQRQQFSGRDELVTQQAYGHTHSFAAPSEHVANTYLGVAGYDDGGQSAQALPSSSVSLRNLTLDNEAIERAARDRVKAEQAALDRVRAQQAALERARAEQAERDRVEDERVRAESDRQAAQDAERYALAASRVNRQWDEKERKVEAAHARQIMAATERLERARRLVEDSGVGEAVISALRLMWHWPELQAKKEWFRPAGMSELFLDPSPVDASDSLVVISWIWDDRHYRLDLSLPAEQKNDEQQENDVHGGLLTLWVEGESVITLDVENPAGGPMERWVMSGVDALNAGPWMPEFVEIIERLKSAEAEKQRQLRFEQTTGKASRVHFAEE